MANSSVGAGKMQDKFGLSHESRKHGGALKMVRICQNDIRAGLKGLLWLNLKQLEHQNLT